MYIFDLCIYNSRWILSRECMKIALMQGTDINVHKPHPFTVSRKYNFTLTISTLTISTI